MSEQNVGSMFQYINTFQTGFSFAAALLTQILLLVGSHYGS